MYNFQDSNGLNFMFIIGLEKDTLPQNTVESYKRHHLILLNIYTWSNKMTRRDFTSESKNVYINNQSVH